MHSASCAGGTMRELRLVGDAPEVKILGEVILSNENELAGSHGGSGRGPSGRSLPPMAPPPQPPIKG